MTTPTPQEVHRQLSSRRERAMQTAFVAKITEYDHDTQTATVQPEQSEVWRDAKKLRTVANLFKIYDVPVMFPAGGGFSITFPLNVGDFVLVTCTKYSLSKWRDGIAGDPGDMRRFSLDGAVAHPVNLYQKDAAISNTESGYMVLSAGGATDFAARADHVDEELKALWSILCGWVVSAADGGAKLQAAAKLAHPTYPSYPPTPIAGAVATACDKIKVE